jgi:microcystin-dependent protein
MASTFSPSLRIELIGDGDQSGIWGQTTNTNLGTLIEQGITGVQAITMLNANYTLTNFNGVSDEARNAVLVVGGTNTAQRDIIAPLVEKTYIVYNNTTGGFAIRIIGASGTGVTIPNGITALVYCDGTNFYNAISGSVGNFTVNGNLAVTGTTALTGALSGSTAVFSGAISSVSPTFTGTPTAPTAAVGTNTTQIATTAFVQAAGLVGEIKMWGTASAPTGYLLCNGASVSTTTYADLFAVIGYTFGGSGASFTLPDYRGRMPIGVSGSYALAATGGSADAVVVSHTHTATSVVSDPTHNHASPKNGAPNGGGAGIAMAGDASGNAPGYATTSASTGITVATTNATAGVSGTGANLPPYLAINFIIKT